MFALRVTVVIETGSAIRKTFAEHLATYQAEELKIHENAKIRGITIETGVRINRILTEFYKPLPKWVAWLTTRQLNKNMSNPQVGYLPLVSNLTKQGYCFALQALSFQAFLIAGFSFAAAI